MEAPSLTSLPPEALGQITQFLSPGSLQSLAKTSQYLREATDPRTLTVPEGRGVTIRALETLPNIQRVEGIVLISDTVYDLRDASRRIRGSLFLRTWDEVPEPPVIGHERMELYPSQVIGWLAVRGLLYPQSLTRIILKQERDELLYEYHQGHLFITIPSVDSGGWFLGGKQVRFLPIFSVGIASISSSYLSRSLSNEFLRDLRDGGVRVTEFVSTGRIHNLNPENVPYLETVRFLLPRSPTQMKGKEIVQNPVILFTKPAPTVTQMQGAIVFQIGLASTDPLPYDLREIRRVYPNVVRGDVFIVQVATSQMVEDYGEEIRDRLLSGVRNFKGDHPDMEVRTEIWTDEILSLSV